MNKSVKFLLDRIQNEFLNNKGLLSQTYPPSENHLLNDFNDYIPFLSFYGCSDLIDKQLTIAKANAVNGLIPIHNRIVSWRQDEWLEALYGRFVDSRDGVIAEMIYGGLEFIKNNLIDNGFIKAFYNLQSHRSPGVFDPRTGALVETLLDIKNDFSAAGGIALKCLDRVIEWSKMNNQYLMPNFIFYKSKIKNEITKINPIKMPTKYLYPYAPGWRAYAADYLIDFPFAREYKLAKQNSNLVNAFLSAYKLTGNREYYYFIINWMKEFKQCLYEEGKSYSSLEKDSVKLSHNHPVIDIYLELHRLTGGMEYLSTAVQMTDYWLSVRFGNGLFPAFVGSSSAHLDNQTDMIVILTKLAKISGRSEYLKIAQSVLEGIIRVHKTENGFLTYADCENGKNNTSGQIHPKYNALLLKAFIAIENSDKILEEYFWQLLRDR